MAKETIESGSIADLRLVEALTFAMGDRNIGDLVSKKAIPQLGHAIVAPIRQRLRIPGGKASATLPGKPHVGERARGCAHRAARCLRSRLAIALRTFA